MASQRQGKGEFTGKHMLIIMVSFFAVVITANVTMAVFAGKSWSGLVVKNSYVASQQFNENVAEAEAQAALGWQPKLALSGGQLRYEMTDGNGKRIALNAVTADFKRPVSTSEDTSVTFEKAADGSFTAPSALRDGLWIAEIHADAGLERPYRDTRRIVISGGALK